MWANFDKETKQVTPCSISELDWNPDWYIAKDFIGDYCVSTVFLGLEHSGGNYFESYIFPAKDGELTSCGELDGKRAATYDEVMNHHQDFVEALASGWTPGGAGMSRQTSLRRSRRAGRREVRE